MIQLSILIPSIPSRIQVLGRLYGKLQQQIGDSKEIEILSFIDNKIWTVGYKRQKLLELANGKYLTFIDDDDDIEMDYIDEIRKGINDKNNVDVICFKESSCINGGNRFIVDYDLGHENEEAKQIDGIWQDINRQPFHKCVWKSSIAKSEKFPNISYGEDWAWASKLCEKAKTFYKIDKVLYLYDYNDKTTETGNMEKK